MFSKELVEDPRVIVFWTKNDDINQVKVKQKATDKLEAKDISLATIDEEGSFDRSESLEDALEASAAEASAFEELANTEEPVAEVATAALSLLSFTVPWEFFTMCLEIIF